MKIRTHLRVGYDKRRRTTPVVATAKPATGPLVSAQGEYLPTVAFAIDFDIPDAMFKRAETVIAELTIPEESAQIAAEVKPR